MKKQVEKEQGFKNLVDHIDVTWRKKKGSQIGYPFRGQDFQALKAFCRHYRAWGLAALWDNFVTVENDWIKKSGYSLTAFFGCLPWLVDLPWKERANKYQDAWGVPSATNILKDLNVMAAFDGKLHETKRKD